jgi:hypothetical protein
MVNGSKNTTLTGDYLEQSLTHESLTHAMLKKDRIEFSATGT